MAIPSKPTTLMSAGTENPASDAARMVRIASRSLLQTMAVGGACSARWCCSICTAVAAKGTSQTGSGDRPAACMPSRSEEHTSELQSQSNLVCRLLLEKKKIILKLLDL